VRREAGGWRGNANRSHPLPSGGSGASNASTVWRQVATAGESNRLPPNRSHPLPSGGSGASKASTVWRQVATSGQVATAGQGATAGERGKRYRSGLLDLF
jgi:hypothetical protein